MEEEVPFAEHQLVEQLAEKPSPTLMIVAVVAASGVHLRIEQIWDYAVDSQHHHPNALHNVRLATEEKKRLNENNSQCR